MTKNNSENWSRRDDKRGWIFSNLTFLILYSMKIKEQTRKLAAGCT